MESQNSISIRFTKPVVRLLVAGVFLIAFFTLTSIIDPSQSTATDSLGSERGEAIGPVLGGGSDPAALMLESLPKDATILGTLEGRAHTVIMTAGDLEPRYSVFTPEGEVLVIEATLSELYELVPGLDISGLIAGGDAYGGVDQGVPIDLDDHWMR